MNPKDISKEKILKLKDCGLVFSSFGLQSASTKIRNIYDRPESLEDIRSANLILNELHIPQFFDLIVDSPYEDKKDLAETLFFLLSLKKPFVAKTFDLAHLPDTKLTKMLLQHKLIQENEVEGNYKISK